MKIIAEGARRSVYAHEIADEEIEAVQVTASGGLKVLVRSEQDPGIGAGLYDLTITFSKKEVFKLYEKAIISDQQVEIKKLKKTIKSLERKLK